MNNKISEYIELESEDDRIIFKKNPDGWIGIYSQVFDEKELPDFSINPRDLNDFIEILTKLSKK